MNRSRPLYDRMQGRQLATNMKKWTVQHFSQGNPVGPGQDDVAALLRRVANTLEEIGPVEVHDLVLHTDLNDHGRHQ